MLGINNLLHSDCNKDSKSQKIKKVICSLSSSLCTGILKMSGAVEKYDNMELGPKYLRHFPAGSSVR